MDMFERLQAGPAPDSATDTRGATSARTAPEIPMPSRPLTPIPFEGQFGLRQSY